VGVTVSRCAQRKIGTPPFGEVAGSRASRLPASADPRTGVVLVDLEREGLEIRADPVGDRALLARWARDRGQLGEELEDVRHGPSVRGAGRVLGADGHGRFGHLAPSRVMREREDDVIRLCAEFASLLPEGVAAEPESVDVSGNHTRETP
jgi:hypothetical protein